MNTPSTQPAAGLDADYEAAMASIHQAIEHFRGCTPEERASLQRDLDQLHSMADKLAAGKVEIVVFGEISTGKSALINALVGEAVAEVNVRGGGGEDCLEFGWGGGGECFSRFGNLGGVLV